MITRFFSITLLVLLFASACQNDNLGFDGVVSSGSQQDTATKQPEVSKSVTHLVKIDTLYTGLAQLLAGVPSVAFDSIQKLDFYQTHIHVVNEAWTEVQQKDFVPIRWWLHESGVRVPEDTMTLFYPFSGPDFLYAHAFYPNVNRTIMVGMEKAGSVPDIANMPQAELANYLESLRYGLRYINKVGYFVTIQMMDDFAKQYLDGNLHTILYYLARTGHLISDIRNITIDNAGRELLQGKNDAGMLTGVRIDYTDSTRLHKKTVYYVPVNLANEGLQKHPEFLSFVNNFGEFAVYVKSGSYLLHYASFNTLRNFITDHASKILQDDTGIPFYLLKRETRFDLEVFGNYTRTIPEFPTMFQSDLKAYCDTQTNHELPFSVGYGDWYDETVLLSAVAKSEYSPSTTTPINSEGLVFKVQIKTASKRLDPVPANFGGLQNVDYYYMDGSFKYTIGKESRIDSPELEKLRQQAVDKGYADAFIIAMYNGRRISTLDAKKMLEKE